MEITGKIKTGNYEGLKIDSRTVKKNNLFLTIKGAKNDDAFKIELNESIFIRQVKIDFFFSCQMTGVTSCLLQFDRKFFCSNFFCKVECKVSNLKNKMVGKQGRLALTS